MIKYWKDVDILDIELRDGKYEYSEEIAEGVILDLDKNGEIMAIEILNVSKRLDNSVRTTGTRVPLITGLPKRFFSSIFKIYRRER